MRRTIQKQPARKNAFTLLELLVVIAIIAILAGLSLAVSGSVRKYTDRTKCLANLRTVAVAINRYAGEHEARMPGPMWTWQSCWYDERDDSSLGHLLAPYLGQPTTSETQKMAVLVCPAWQRGAPYRQDQSWLLNTEVLVNGAPMNPWGDADVAYEADEDAAQDPEGEGNPKLLAQFAEAPLSRTWAIQDLDAQSPVRKKPGGIAPKPVHGDKRNAIFFDWHAESVPLDYKP